MATCEFRDGNRRCRRQGSGTPAICAQHREAMAAFHAAPPTIGSQLGSILESVISGRKPSDVQINQVVAGVAGRVMGREVSAAEVAEARVRMARGEPPWPSSSGSDGPDPASEAWKRANEWRQKKSDPAKAREEYERKQRLVAIAKARQTMGFGPREKVTKDELKARYRKLAKEWHPDLHGGSGDQMTELNEAMEVLQGSM